VDFGWDIVEPISYAITFTVAIWGMIYYSLFKHDYTFTDTIKRLTMSKQYKRYQKVNFDVDNYNSVRFQVEDVRSQLSKISKLLGENK
jgi:hypothetical protein